jgi:uncharacterized protein YggE
MRLVILAGCALGLALSSARSPAQAPVSVAPLAAREVLLEVDAVGRVTNPADVATVTIPVSLSRPSASEARKAAAAQAERIVAALHAAGVASADMRTYEPGRRRFGFMGSESAEAPGEVAAALGDIQPKAASRTIEVRLSDPATFDRVRGAAEVAGAGSVAGPVYSLKDEAPARAAAKADAIAKAREQAADYARALGMRVGRILRVSERGSPNIFSVQQMQGWMQEMMGKSGPDDGRVETTVTVSVDFALVPGA